MKLQDSVIAITGGGQGLGRAMGEYLAAKGAKIALIDLMPEKLDEAVTACVAAGAEARSYVCNVAKEEEVEKTFEAIVKDFGHLNGLVNNAGILRDGLMVKVKDGEVERRMELSQWQAVIDVNLTGVFLCGREAATQMIKNGDQGAIINIASISRAGNMGQANYSAAKAGMQGFTKSLAIELGPFGIEEFANHKLVRSPGVYFDRVADKTSDKDIYTAKIIPSRGAWLEFEIDKRDMVGVRVDRKRKQSATVLLKALGMSEAEIREALVGVDANGAERHYESVDLTLEKDTTEGQDDALLDLYRKLRPGEPPTREAAQTLLDNLYFNPKRYDTAKVGRYKMNRKLGVEVPLEDSVLSIDDIVATIRYLVALHAGDETLPGTRDGEAYDVPVEVDPRREVGRPARHRAVGLLRQRHPDEQAFLRLRPQVGRRGR